MADGLGSLARPRLPVPPVPPPVAPHTTAAPFAAVPSPAPEREPLRPSATVLEERRPAASVLDDIPAPAGPPLVSQPVPESPSRPLSGWADGEHPAPWSTGRGEIRADRSPAGRPADLPFVERRASRLPGAALRSSAGKAEAPAYGDWTKPSGRVMSAPVPPMPPVPPAPLTTAIPDRDISGRSAVGVDDLDTDRHEDDRYDDPVADPRDRTPSTPGHVTGTVVGGRAALRAEREAREATRVAAEAARRKRDGIDDLDDRPRRPRRVLQGLLAVGVVAAAVMGVYTVASPRTEETAATTAPSTHTPAPIAPTDAAEVTAILEPLDIDPDVPDAPTATAPVRVPVTVLNSTEIVGLAADVSAAIEGEGWKTAKPGGYPKEDIAASTVFFTKGDDEQREAALQLVEQFPQLQGPTPRFFEVPAQVDAPALVVVVTGDWKP
jgi:LytR cell envelope-related transcriptional attenuator